MFGQTVAAPARQSSPKLAKSHFIAIGRQDAVVSLILAIRIVVIVLLEVRAKDGFEVAAVDVMSECGLRDSMVVQLASSSVLHAGRWHPEAGLVSRARRGGDWCWRGRGIVKPRGGQWASRAARWRLSPGVLAEGDVWMGGLSSELGAGTS